MQIILTCYIITGTTQTRGQIPHILYYSNPQDSDGQHTNKAMAESKKMYSRYDCNYHPTIERNFFSGKGKSRRSNS